MRVNGRNRSETFSKRSDATRWSRTAELQAERGELAIAAKVRFELWQRHLHEFACKMSAATGQKVPCGTLFLSIIAGLGV